MTEDLNIKMWADIEKTISAFGSVNKAKELRHKYFNSSITDEVFEVVWPIFAAELRQSMEKVYEKYEIDPNVIRKERVARGPRQVKAPKTFKELAQRKETAKTRKTGGLSYKVLDEDL